MNYIPAAPQPHLRDAHRTIFWIAGGIGLLALLSGIAFPDVRPPAAAPDDR